MINKVILVGHLGKDPELKFTSGGKAVAEFSVATSSKRKEGEKLTEWHDVVAWGAQAESCNEHLRKGSKAYIEGYIKTESWDKDGVKKYRTRIVALNVVFLDQRPDSKEKEDDLPF